MTEFIEGVNLRKVKNEDLKSFVDCYIKAYSDLEEYKYRKVSDIKNYFKWLLKRDSEALYVAERNSKAIGFVAGDRHWVGFDGKKVLEIHELFVIPEEQKKGIGKGLLEKVLDLGKRSGLEIAELWVGEHNKRAQKFYLKLGFEEVGKWGKWICMRRPLRF